MNQPDESVRIKINVCQGRKYGFTGKYIDRLIRNADLAAFNGNLGKPFNSIQQQVLQRRHIRFFAAYTYGRTCFSFGCLRTLKTKYIYSPLFKLICYLKSNLYFWYCNLTNHKRISPTLTYVNKECYFLKK